MDVRPNGTPRYVKGRWGWERREGSTNLDKSRRSETPHNRKADTRRAIKNGLDKTLLQPTNVSRLSLSIAYRDDR